MSDNVAKKAPFSIHTKTVETIHDIYLSDKIESDAFKYQELFNHLANIPETDTVNLHLANFGGACHTGIRIVNALRDCSAPVNVYVTAPCYSMGAIIAICGNGLAMWPGTFLMFHNYSTIEAGKGGEVITAINEYQKMFKSILQKFCTPFLSKIEVDKLCKDEDVYVHATDKDMKTRLKKHYKEKS